jgi:hypothetical protein
MQLGFGARLVRDPCDSQVPDVTRGDLKPQVSGIVAGHDSPSTESR